MGFCKPASSARMQQTRLQQLTTLVLTKKERMLGKAIKSAHFYLRLQSHSDNVVEKSATVPFHLMNNVMTQRRHLRSHSAVPHPISNLPTYTEGQVSLRRSSNTRKLTSERSVRKSMPATNAILRCFQLHGFRVS